LIDAVLFVLVLTRWLRPRITLSYALFNIMLFYAYIWWLSFVELVHFIVCRHALSYLIVSILFVLEWLGFVALALLNSWVCLKTCLLAWGAPFFIDSYFHSIVWTNLGLIIVLNFLLLLIIFVRVLLRCYHRGLILLL